MTIETLVTVVTGVIVGTVMMLETAVAIVPVVTFLTVVTEGIEVMQNTALRVV